jgi:hypothetical protein
MIELGKPAVPSADMSSYSSLLERKIKEIEHDPAEMRQVVYDVARLALKQGIVPRDVEIHEAVVAG